MSETPGSYSSLNESEMAAAHIGEEAAALREGLDHLEPCPCRLEQLRAARAVMRDWKTSGAGGLSDPVYRDLYYAIRQAEARHGG